MSKSELTGEDAEVASAAQTTLVGEEKQRASEKERKVLRGGERELGIVHTALYSPTKFGQASDGREEAVCR